MSQTCTSRGCSAIIEKLVINATGQIYIGTAGDEKIANCQSVSNVYFTLSPNNKAFDAMYAALLTYKSIGKPIYIRISEGSIGCQVVYIDI